MASELLEHAGLVVGQADEPGDLGLVSAEGAGDRRAQTVLEQRDSPTMPPHGTGVNPSWDRSPIGI